MARKSANFPKFCVQPNLHKSLTTKQPKKRCDIRKHHSKQAKTGGVERISNYKMFTNPVFINPSGNILTEKVFARRDKVN